MSILVWTLAGALVIVGLLGIVLPAVPGTILILFGLILAAWADGFMRVGPWTLMLIGVIGAVSYGVDFAASAIGAKRFGASRVAMIGAALGTLAGLLFGLAGLVFGPFVGAVMGELTATRNFKQAGRAGLAAWLGFAIGTAVKVGLAFLMVAIFAAAMFWGK